MQPCFSSTDFHITGGTVTLTGPSVVQLVAAGQVPPGCSVTGSTATCPIAVIGGGSNDVDTGVPAAAGHYSLTKLFGSAVPPGAHIDIQVTQVR